MSIGAVAVQERSASAWSIFMSIGEDAGYNPAGLVAGPQYEFSQKLQVRGSALIKRGLRVSLKLLTCITSPELHNRMAWDCKTHRITVEWGVAQRVEACVLERFKIHQVYYFSVSFSCLTNTGMISRGHSTSTIFPPSNASAPSHSFQLAPAGR